MWYMYTCRGVPSCVWPGGSGRTRIMQAVIFHFVIYAVSLFCTWRSWISNKVHVHSYVLYTKYMLYGKIIMLYGKVQTLMMVAKVKEVKGTFSWNVNMKTVGQQQADNLCEFQGLIIEPSVSLQTTIATLLICHHVWCHYFVKSTDFVSAKFLLPR